MKLKKILMAAFVVPLAFTACDKSEEMDDSRNEVKIVAAIGASADSKLKAAFENDGSGEFETGDEYSLSFWSPTLGMGEGFLYQIGSTVLYWDQVSTDGNPIDFTAWYPYYNFSGITI
ncbi:MAG: fimbrillin family protein, partial [Tannerellaceae bacterium]|nr:fimbrillin family protein [Tannerellaceae bacterium]